MFEKIDDSVRSVAKQARAEAARLSSESVNCQHLLLALTTSSDEVVPQALTSMSITHDALKAEIERQIGLGGGQLRQQPQVVPQAKKNEVVYSDAVHKVFERANHFRLNLGQKSLMPEHVLLAVIESGDDGLSKILEEIGANVDFLQRQIMCAVAKRDCFCPDTTGIGKSLTTGLGELVAEHARTAEEIKTLAAKVGRSAGKLPDRSEIALLIFVSYLPEFLSVQVAFQRYILEETLHLLTKRTGTLDQEVNATMVSTSAQNLRKEVRAAIEQIWSQELRLLSQLPTEADHDLIGSVIEDLWWTHSEEIALHEVFDEALDDHRRQQMLNLQKRRLEISERLTKLRSRLEQTVKESLLKGISV